MKINYWQKLEPDITYHIYNRGVDGANIFRDNSDYQLFLRLFSKYINPYVDVLAYCLMPNHYHLLIKIKDPQECVEYLEKEQTKASEKLLTDEMPVDFFFSDQFRRMFSAYAMKYNNKYKRKGPLFSPKVKRVAIVEPSRIVNLICYLHHNPIHHGFKNKYSDWKNSSYAALSSIKPTIVFRDMVLELMNGIEGFNSTHDLFKLSKSDELIDAEWI